MVSLLLLMLLPSSLADKASNMTWFNGSSFCLDTNLISTSATFTYTVQQKLTCSLYICNETVILPLIYSLYSDSSDLKAITQLFYIRESCLQLFSSNPVVKMAYINVERRMIHTIMNTSWLMNGPMNYRLKALSLNVFNITETDLNSAGNKLRIQIEAPQLLPQNKSYIPEIWLPVNALHTIPKERRVIGLVSYMQHSQFEIKHEDISSMVLRIELLEEQHLYNLKTSIQMIFKVDVHRNMDNDSRLQCHYFDEQEGLWKTNGCETSTRTLDNQTDIVCNCNHATPFTVLLIREPIAEVHWKILSYISYIGCGLSAFFSALSILVYVFSQKHRKDYSISIHVSLSGALFLLNSTFLLTEWGATVKPNWVCVFIAVFMHYSLLSCFTWMAIEALHLYLLLIKVFNTYYKHYLVKLSLAGWGIPGVIVAVSLGLNDLKQLYGVTKMTMADTNQTNAICWITDDTFFYSLNLAYFSLIFIFNSGILVAVASSIVKMKQVFRRNVKLGAETMRNTWREMLKESCRNGITVLGLTCLMGTTWGLAFLGSGYVNYPLLYLFSILNSTQGLFIFLWICQSDKKQRKRELENRTISTPMTTAGTKSD
ncbi:adhesion G-protein coupled receptor G2-like isoform X2 [Mastacembelus armatus]|uniref:adhesion G-protein coupled receptor G2-like isoform X2 n=1 Tax=Mastacembelus armatus TaxID=205130 RepID=UPI001436767D|nr:adhesion G-protein coupled receptor G2-like isoform X2 [Mastacembelus armatus]